MSDNLSAYEKHQFAKEEREANLLRTGIRAIAVVIICVIASIAGCASNTAYQKRILAEKINDPVGVACLYEGSTNGVCAIAKIED